MQNHVYGPSVYLQTRFRDNRRGAHSRLALLLNAPQIKNNPRFKEIEKFDWQKPQTLTH